jgi:hypothetical protein
MLPIMPSFRDFWVPFLFVIVGLIPALFAGSATGNARKAMLTWTAFFLFLAVLFYIWGDPVRGPFASLRRPHDATTFALRAGMACTFPVSELKDGIDLSRCIAIEGRPIELWIRKTWWSGLYVKLTLKGADDKPVLVFDNKSKLYVAEGLDLNYDDYAFEVVDDKKSPAFQLVITEDYSSIYVNARFISEKEALLLKDGGLKMREASQMNQPEMKLERIFKYPSYIHQGERE